MRPPCLDYRCPLDWSALAGAGATRHCSQCDRDVHDLSALGPVRAAEVLERSYTERVCVRFQTNRFGGIRFAAAALAATLAANPALADDPNDHGSWETETRPGEGHLPRVSENMGVVMGALDRTLIDTQIKAEMLQFRRAYTKRLKKKPELRGKVTFKFVIQADGAVANVSLKQSELDDEVLEEALVEVMAGVSFADSPPRGKGIVIVSYPMVFEPG